MKRTKRHNKRRIATIRTELPSPTWRLLNMGLLLSDRVNHILLCLPMLQAHRETLIEARDFIIKTEKKRKRK